MFLKQMISISFPIIKHTAKSNILNKLSKFYSFFLVCYSFWTFNPRKRKQRKRQHKIKKTYLRAFDDGKHIWKENTILMMFWGKRNVFYMMLRWTTTHFVSSRYAINLFPFFLFFSFFGFIFISFHSAVACTIRFLSISSALKVLVPLFKLLPEC